MQADKVLYDAVMANDVAAVRKCLASGTHAAHRNSIAKFPRCVQRRDDPRDCDKNGRFLEGSGNDARCYAT